MSRSFVIDADSFAMDDPEGNPFAFAWREITGIETGTAWAGGAPLIASRRLDHVLVRTREREMYVRLAGQPRTVLQVADGVQQFAPQLWAGHKTSKARRFQLS
ncbi:hypothetical protein [Amycolatopsis alkalitolerans]|uniref:Uncharacterized protein n=1 Tax=Amycolatopsis alkalitolerans TaxID=2547244 RepID=A0A5C4M5F6_9PSEU|nr:hypothetical protein [Amycolatopsis alkalitolerans]TNC28474.1 hypothetical protein FG385_04120 [Amycolatopsis alkalitolerans]